MIEIKLLILTMAFAVPATCHELLFWGYECHNSKCIKVKLNQGNVFTAVGLQACRIYCGGKLGTVWPKPTGLVRIAQHVTAIRSKIKFNIPSQPNVEQLWRANKRRFQSQIESKIPDKTLFRNEGRTLTIKITLSQTPEQAEKVPSLRYDTDESYSLTINNLHNDVRAEIKANSFFGARHGLETLSQLIVYDENRQEIFILAEAEIIDAPAFKHRGILLDTGRNFFSLKSIKRTIDAMAMAKLNTFHWHIVDSVSFPLVIKSQPDLHTIGAYSPRKIYTHEDIAELVEYARARGVRVYPDFDAPGHAGEGWQLQNVTVCFNKQPWQNYCPLPPCGQLDPTKENLYSILEDIYREIFEIFDLDVFHMGGSQVILRCWQEDQQIRNWMTEKGWGLEKSDFIRLWGYFQAKALAKVDKVSHEEVPIMLWSNELSHIDYIDQYINNSRYIIQSTTAKGSGELRDALQHGYRVVLSNYDALFLDCGFGSTVDYGNNWCSPYNNWQKIYENRPNVLAGPNVHLVLGAEATNWSESLDEQTLDARFWPRSSALAERLWSNPVETWKEAEARMLVHRTRLVENGIAAESVQPEWCLQNQNECPKV